MKLILYSICCINLLFAAKPIILNENSIIQNYGNIVYITPLQEENCGNYGEYQYQPNSNKYISINFQDNKEFKLLKNCTYSLVPIKNNLQNNLNFKSIDINNLNDMTNLFNDYIKNQNIDDDINTKNINIIKNKIEQNLINFDKKQYLGLVNLNTQTFYIYYIDIQQNNITFIGKSLISSGNKTRGKKYFDTPITIVDRKLTSQNDWFAQGTDGKGFGNKGEQIFWLGIHNGIHLAMHTTTPWGIENLGKKMSKGCIRISPIFNKILRETKIFNGEYGRFIIIDTY